MRSPTSGSPGSAVTTAAADVAVTRDELVRWGEALGRRLEPGAVVALHGDLGTGKTTLAQAICRGYGTTDDVTSPTFALVHEYAAPRSPICHLDLYRLESPADLQNIGFDDIVSSGVLVLIEWPERAGPRLPAARIDVRLAHLEADTQRRRLVVEGT